MEILTLVFWLFKWLIILTASFLIYLTWKFLISPWKTRRFYKQFKNVYISPKLNFPEGDVKTMNQLVSEGKFRFGFLYMGIDAAHYDIRLGNMGSTILFDVMSPQAMAEISHLIPDKVDRSTDREGVQFARAFLKSTALKRTEDDYKKTRTVFLKLLGFNFASKYIPTMIDVIREKVETWKEGDKIDCLHEMGDVALKIIVRVMFGKDINNRIPEMNYTKKNGEVVKMDFYHFFPALMRDYLVAVFEPQNQIFPFLFTKGWLYPNNINERNCNELRRTVKEFLDKLEDKDSIYRQLIDDEGFNADDIFDDIIGLLHAAHQTSHHTVSSVLYFIKKHPKWFEKLRSELNKAGVDENCDYSTAISRDVIQETQSLAFIVKETLRIDPAGARSLIYTAYEDVQICGVPIPKGSKMYISVLSAHHNSEQWPQPNVFKPERFDPSSEDYYIGVDKSTPKNPFAYIPFSFNIRKCPGMILALTEIKTLICYLATKIDYSIDKELLENDNARFGIYTNFNLTLNIEKIR